MRVSPPRTFDAIVKAFYQRRRALAADRTTRYCAFRH